MNKAPTLMLFILLAALLAGCAGANQPAPTTESSPAAQTDATTGAQNATTSAQNSPYPAADSYPAPQTDATADSSPAAQTDATTSGQNSAVPPTPSQPAADKATVTGRALNEDGTPVAEGTVVRLAETYYQGSDGAYALDESRSPGANTDAAGYFVFSDIPAREYVLIIGDIYTVYKVVPKPDGLPQTYNPEPGQILDLGEIKVDLS
jgi:hypothetical protein